MPFTHTLRVRYAEVDAQDVVFNAHYLTYVDEAMTRFVEHLGYDPRATFTEGGDLDVMLVRCELEWQGSAAFEDEVTIAVEPVRLGRSSFDLRFTLTVDGAPVATATTTYVSVVPGEKRSTPIPDRLRAELESRC